MNVIPSNSSSPQPEGSHEVVNIVEALKVLMASSKDSWISWERVSKRIHGTNNYAPFLMAYAFLPQWKHLFATHNNVVRLTEAGLKFQAVAPVPQLPETHRIAQAVTDYASHLRDIKLRVENVQQVTQVAGKFIEAVYVDLTEDVVTSETPVVFIPDGGGYTHGKIVGQEPDGRVLYIAFDHVVDASHLPGKLRVDRAYLLAQLAEQLRTLSEIPKLIKPILGRMGGTISLIANEDSIAVANMLLQLQTPWTRMLWGPPGAGKTYGLGHFVKELIKSPDESRILITAPSNRAIDVALEQLIGQLERSGMRSFIRERRILRYGYPRKQQILERSELLGPSNLDLLNQEVKRLSAQIHQAENEKSAGEVEMAVLRARLLAAQEEVKNAVSSHIEQSRIVATTTTLAYLPTSPIAKFQWGTVVIDEVTMVYPAMCTYIASLATDRLLLAGDPRQLGPVYESSGNDSNNYEWMGRDIFEKGGVSKGEGLARQINTSDPKLARITSQRRCADGIWAGVENLYPEVAQQADAVRLQELTALPPYPGQAMVLFDTSITNGQAKCVKANHSWQNEFTAELALEIAFTMVAEAKQKISVAIISPYRAQVRLLRKWLRQEQKAENSPYLNLEIESGTVHQFQGSDADVVIFDLVDGPGRNKLGALLCGDAGIRLVNVALTRARGKFILLANRMWCRDNIKSEDNPLLHQLVNGTRNIKTVRVDPPAHVPSAVISQRNLTESPIEEKLFDELSQHPEISDLIAQFCIRDAAGTIITRADFAFPSVKYAIYCDGRQWHLKEDRWQRDLRQRNKLTEIGWAFSVFSGAEIHQSPKQCVEQIVKTYKARLQLLKLHKV